MTSIFSLDAQLIDKLLFDSGYSYPKTKKISVLSVVAMQVKTLFHPVPENQMILRGVGDRKI